MAADPDPAGRLRSDPRRVHWLEGLLDRLDERECRVCGASLSDARTVVERSPDGRMTAVLYCRTCRARNLAEASKAA